MTKYDPAKKRAYYLAHQEEKILKSRLRYRANTEALKAKQKERNKKPLSPQQREIRRLRSAQWYLNNRVEALRQNKLYQQEHPEVAKKAIAKYCSTHRQQIRARNRADYAAHREQRIVEAICKNRVREAQKRNTLADPLGIKQWMKQIKSLPFTRCHWCGTKIHGRFVHFDHVVPISKGGTHTIGNLCAACPPCNQSKSARALGEWICQGQTFLPL